MYWRLFASIPVRYGRQPCSLHHAEDLEYGCPYDKRQKHENEGEQAGLLLLARKRASGIVQVAEGQTLGGLTLPR